MSPRDCLRLVRAILPREPELAPVAELLERVEERDRLAAARTARYRERQKASGVGRPEAGSAMASQPRATREAPTPPSLPPEQQPLKLVEPLTKMKLPPGRKRLPSDPNDDELAIVEMVLGKLSANSGRSYKACLPRGGYTENCRLIVRLLRDGYTEHDLRIVVWERSTKWAKDPEANQWLQPSTLFGPLKFQQYLPHATSAWALFEQEKRRTGREPTGDALRALVEVAEQEGREYGQEYDEEGCE